MITSQDLIDDAKIAKAKLSYGCKFRGLKNCPCELNNSDKCEGNEFYEAKFSLESLVKFSHLVNSRALEQACNLTEELNPPDYYTQVEREAYSLGIVHYWQKIRTLIQKL